MIIHREKKGFVLLVAVLISALLLSLGIAILNSTLKELRLSSLGRDSQFAFYASDSGSECALYWDIRGRAFATSTDSKVPTSGLFCNNQDITANPGWSSSKTSNSAKTTFSLSFPPESYCVTVVVDKVGSKTTIESRGYNTCDPNNPRRVERALRTVY